MRIWISRRRSTTKGHSLSVGYLKRRMNSTMFSMKKLGSCKTWHENTSRGFFYEQEMLNSDLDKKRQELSAWSKELNRREALTERDRQKLEEENKKNDLRNSALQMTTEDQRKAYENVIRLVEEQKREKEEALKKVRELERNLDEKQKVEMDIEELKGKLEVMKHMGGDDDAAVQENIKEMNDALQDKKENYDDMEEVNQQLLKKEHQNNYELQEARKALIEVWYQRINFFNS